MMYTYIDVIHLLNVIPQTYSLCSDNIHYKKWPKTLQSVHLKLSCRNLLLKSSVPLPKVQLTDRVDLGLSLASW